jgi:hypothetical protein
MSESRKTFKAVLLVVSITLVCAFAAILVFVSIFPPREHYSSYNICINNLRMIDAAKNEWALEHNAKTNDTPTWEDIKPYLERDPEHDKPFVKFDPKSNLPICPSGGVYTIGKIGEPPTCSLGTNVVQAHVLP